MPHQNITPVDDARDLACENPHSLSGCQGWAVVTIDGTNYCDVCRTFAILDHAGMSPTEVTR